MKNNSFRNIWINSSILFVVAAVLEMTLHEGAHATVAFFLHAPNLSLHHNYVHYDTGPLTSTQLIAIAAAGPLMSLLIGFLFHFAVKQYSTPNLFRLFLIYMSAFGYIGFLGYVLIAPFFVYGDTGFVFKTLNFPIYATVTLAVAAGFLLYLAMKSLCKEFIPFLDKTLYENDETRKIFFNFLIQYPLYTGILITTLLNLPVPTPLSLIAPLCSPFSIMWGFGPLMRKKYDYPANTTAAGRIDQLSYSWLIVLILIMIMNRILAEGISL